MSDDNNHINTEDKSVVEPTASGLEAVAQPYTDDMTGSHQLDTASEHSNEKQEIVDDHHPVMVQNPRWYNKSHKVFGITIPAYNHSLVQLLMVSFVFFLCPGMFNALSGLGGSGLPPEFADTSANSNVALYCTFATVGFFSGTIVNTIGPKMCLAIGGLGYAINSASLLCFNHTQNTGFVIAAGAILGICASMLWAAQGVVIMAYPVENAKGHYVAIFWAIFNLGSVIGGLIPLAQNLHQEKTGGVNDGTYAAFLALMLVGAVLSLTLMPIDKVAKSDGTGILVKKNPTIKSEIMGLYKLLRYYPSVLLLFPMFFCSNWFYTYQFNDFNGSRFNVRTRSLNSILYWFMQIVGALTWGLLLDWGRYSRKTRARAFHIIVFVLTMAIWGGGLAFEKLYTREDVERKVDPIAPIDWTDGGKTYIGPMFLYMFYGLFDAIWQTYVYWILGALTNSSRKLALYAGFYKGIQSAGNAIVWRLDAIKKPYAVLFGTSWGLLVASLIISAPLVFFRVKEVTDFEDDAMFTEDLHDKSEVAKVAHEWDMPAGDVEIREDEPKILQA